MVMKYSMRCILVILVLCGVGLWARTAEAQGFKHTSQEDMYYMKMKNRTGSTGLGYFQVVDIHFKERMRHNHGDRDWFAWRFDIGGVPYFYIDDFQRVGSVAQSYVNTAAATSRGTTGAVGSGSNWGWGHGWDSGYGGYGGGGGGGGHRNAVDPRITWFPDMNIEEILDLSGNKQHPSWEYEINGSGSLYSSFAGLAEEKTDYMASDRQEFVDVTPPIVEFGIPVSGVIVGEEKISIVESLGAFLPMAVVEQAIALVSVEPMGGVIGFEEREAEVKNAVVSMDGYSMEMVPTLIPVSPVVEFTLSTDAALLCATNGLLTLGEEMTEQVGEVEEQARYRSLASSQLLRSSMAMNVGTSNFTDFDSELQNVSALSGDTLMLSGSISEAQGGKTTITAAKPMVSEQPRIASESIPMVSEPSPKTNDVPEPSGFLLLLLGWAMLQRKLRNRR